MWVSLMAALVLLWSSAGDAAAQSFDCAKAQTRTEKMICADRAVADLDEYLGRYYAAARSDMPGAAACLQADQSQWLKSTRDACADASCLKSAYLNRLAELDPLQPGATALKNVDLPAVPALVWIVPPAADKVAAPPNPKAKPYQAIGTIVDDIASNPDSEGIVLRLKDGTRVPLVMTMFLESPTQDRLASLARTSPSATFRASGFAATDPAGKSFFEPSRCVFIHRMPAVQARPAAQSKPPAEDADQDMERVRSRVVTQGKVCADPDRPCPGFKPNELSFAIGSPFKFDRGKDRSQPFYAVILKSAPLCGIADDERVRAQKAFPRAKVFLHRYFCEDFGDKVTYSNVNEKSGFVAVYAGESEGEGQKVLAQARAGGYSDANLRRMEVIVTYQIE
jgi:uncharacterized protein